MIRNEDWRALSKDDEREGLDVDGWMDGDEEEDERLAGMGGARGVRIFSSRSGDDVRVY